MWRIRIVKKFKRIFILGIIDTMYLISYELVYTIGITMLTPDRIDKQVNLAGIDQSWTNLLNHLDIDSHPGDSGEVVTPFVQVGTYPTRNFATLGPL